MHHIVYVSTPTRPFDAAEWEALLADAREFNAAHGVTGVLVHTEAGFLQLLEGELDDVELVFRRLSASSLHTGVLRTPAVPVARRVFPDWSMGFDQALPGQLVELVLEPLVRHRLVDGDLVRSVLLERWWSRAAA